MEILRVTTITRCFNTSSNVGTLNVLTPPFFSIKQYWIEDNSHCSHIKTIPVQNTGTMDFRYTLKWKSYYSLEYHAIQFLSTDLKLKNLNCTPYMYVLIVHILCTRITSMFSLFIHLKHATSIWNKIFCCLHFYFQSARYLWDLRFPLQSHRGFWSTGMLMSVIGFVSPQTFQRNIKH